MNLLGAVRRASSMLWRVILVGALAIVSVHASATEKAEIYSSYRHLNDAVVQYYLTVEQLSPSREGARRKAMDASVNAVLSGTAADSVDPAEALMREIAEYLAGGSDFYIDNEYADSIGERVMEENYSALRAIISTYRPATGDVAAVYGAYESMVMALHYYCAFHASFGGELMNPVIASTNISTLVMQAEKDIKVLVDAYPKDQDLRQFVGKWKFLSAGLMGWQEYEVVHLVSRYYPQLTETLVQKM